MSEPRDEKFEAQYAEFKKEQIKSASSSVFAWVTEFEDSALRCMKIFIDNELQRREGVSQ